jgi:hypothetical protein
MCERFRTAILTCGEIDDDANYYDSEADRGEDYEGNGEEEGSDEDSGEGEDESSDESSSSNEDES